MEWIIKILEQSMFCILFAKERIIYWYLPIDFKQIILYVYTTIRLWSIIIIALVLEYCCLRENSKAVSESMRNKESTMVVLC